MKGNFLAINKKYYGLGLKSIDLLIIAQVEEFQRNGCECYVTNEQFSEQFGESVDTVKRSLNKLENLDIITRHTTSITGKGRANKQRKIYLKPRNEWKVQNAPTIKMEGANVDNGRCKNQQCEVQNAPIKDNLKENKKITLEGKREISDLSDDEGNDICNRLKRNESYISLSDKYNLPRGSITKDFPKQWQEIIKNRTYWTQYEIEKNQQRNEPRIDYDKLYAASKHNLDIKENELDLEEIMKDMFCK